MTASKVLAAQDYQYKRRLLKFSENLHQNCLKLVTWRFWGFLNTKITLVTPRYLMHKVTDISSSFRVFRWILAKIVRNYLLKRFLGSLNSNMTLAKAFRVPGAQGGRHKRRLLVIYAKYFQKSIKTTFTSSSRGQWILRCRQRQSPWYLMPRVTGMNVIFWRILQNLCKYQSKLVTMRIFEVAKHEYTTIDGSCSTWSLRWPVWTSSPGVFNKILIKFARN